MSELKEVISELKEIRAAVESLRSEFTIAQITYFENLPISAVVGADYVAYRFGVSSSAVVRGRFDTDRIRRIRQKPLAFIKREVDAVFNELHQPLPEVAAGIRYKKNYGKNRKL